MSSQNEGKHSRKASSVPPPLMPKSGSYTNDEMEEYAQVFALFDTDGSGAIGTDELGEAMVKMGMNASQRELEVLINEVDADGNGEIDFDEFCACMKRMTVKQRTNDEIIRECFTVFDQDTNDVISETEFKHVMREVGRFPNNFTDDFFKEIDVFGNGQIEYEEFAMMLKTTFIRRRRTVTTFWIHVYTRCNCNHNHNKNKKTQISVTNFLDTLYLFVAMIKTKREYTASNRSRVVSKWCGDNTKRTVLFLLFNGTKCRREKYCLHDVSWFRPSVNTFARPS